MGIWTSPKSCEWHTTDDSTSLIPVSVNMLLVAFSREPSIHLGAFLDKLPFKTMLGRSLMIRVLSVAISSHLCRGWYKRVSTNSPAHLTLFFSSFSDFTTVTCADNGSFWVSCCSGFFEVSLCLLKSSSRLACPIPLVFTESFANRSATEE